LTHYDERTHTVNKTVAATTAVQSVLVALVLLNVVSLTDEQIAGIVAATTAVLGAVLAWVSPKVPFGQQ